MNDRNNTFNCLGGRNVVKAKVSDHHPIVHNGVLFWNVMMQGQNRNGRYNNGFGIVETGEQYTARLIKIAFVIAEIIFKNPSIETIGLCEGPIASADVLLFLKGLNQFQCMKRFLKNNLFYKPHFDKYPNWGLIMLTDETHEVSSLECKLLENDDRFLKLKNRFQLWCVKNNDQNKYFALAHFPFSGDESIKEQSKLSEASHLYRGLINCLLEQYSNNIFVFCADFNFNPYLINQWHDRPLDKIAHNNSILFSSEEKNPEQRTQSVTVDGILLSSRTKQKLYTKLAPAGQLFQRLKYEFGLFKSSLMGPIILKNNYALYR